MGNYDLLTVVAHEIGHLLGFSVGFSGFARHIVMGESGQRYFVADGIFAAIRPEGHLATPSYRDDLMSGHLLPGIRKLPSGLDISILKAALGGGAFGDGGEWIINYLHTTDHLDPHGGFILFADAIVNDLQAGPPEGVADGGFDVDDSPAWNQSGGADISGGVATLTEGNLLFSDVSQVFKIPTGAESIRFSVSGLSLNANDGNPPDAFEVALLDAVGIGSLARVAGLSQTDALLNIQADGTVFLADGVTITGDVNSGSFDVTISLAGARAGDPVALFFDLIRFGNADSSVTIDGVTVNASMTTDPEAPVVDAGADTAGIDEGSRLTRAGSFHDANGADVYTATVDYGDGGGVETLTLVGDGFLLDHLYAQDGTYLVTVNVTDGTGLVGTDTILVTVANVVPTVEAGGDRSVDLGAPVLVTATFTDPGGEDTHTATIDWGDGTVESVAVDQVNDVLAAGHSYGVVGGYTVTVTVTDSDGGVGWNSFQVSVLFAAPTVNAFGPPVVNEGAAYRLQLVASGASAALITGWVIDWGDGSAPEMIAGQPLEAFHSFAGGPDILAIRATALIGTTEYHAAPVTVRVMNEPPVLGGITHETVIDEGGTVTVSGSFTDGGTTDTHTLHVDWGDGTVETLSIPHGDRTFTLTHQYLDNLPGDAPYPVSLTISDDDGGESGRSLAIVVRNLAPVGSVVFPQTAVRGVLQRFSSSVSDPSASDSIEISWDFGDGTVLPFRSVDEAGALAPGHTFSAPGVYSVSMILRDSDGAVGITEGLLVVGDVPGESGDRGASDPTGRAPIPGSRFGFFGESASDRKTLVSFLSVGEWIAERVFGAPGSFPDGLVLPGGFFFTSPGWMAWRSLYEQSLREMLETEFQIAETLRITEADAVVSEQAGVVSLVVTLTFNQDVAGRIEAGDLVIRDAEEGDGTEISMRYDPQTKTAVFTVTLPGSVEPSDGAILVVIPDTALADGQGLRLDGDGDGEPGGDFELTVPLTEE